MENTYHNHTKTFN